jgi:hypothetical protein
MGKVHNEATAETIKTSWTAPNAEKTGCTDNGTSCFLSFLANLALGNDCVFI